jgi:phosphatidylserine decarboxylase
MGSLPLSSRAVRTAWRVAPKRAYSGAVGWGAGIGIPGWFRPTFLARFARLYGIDVTEAERSLADYRTLDAFFTRRLREGARQIDGDPDAVVAPSDGTVIESGVVTEGHLVQVKGVLFELDDLLGDGALAARFEGGGYLTTYLSPRDYHRVHSPVAGAVVGWRYVPGTLYPVGAKSVAREPGLFISNERLVTFIDAGQAGLCALVMVAAVGVGHITAAYDETIATHQRSFMRGGTTEMRYDVPRPVAKGQEIGTFHLGSTTIVVFESARVTLGALAPGALTRMGEAIGRVQAVKTGAIGPGAMTESA